MNHFRYLQNSPPLRTSTYFSTDPTEYGFHAERENVPSSFVEFFASDPINQQRILTQEQIESLDTAFRKYYDKLSQTYIHIGPEQISDYFIQDTSLYILYLMTRLQNRKSFPEAVYYAESLINPRQFPNYSSEASKPFRNKNDDLHISMQSSILGRKIPFREEKDQSGFVEISEWKGARDSWRGSFANNVLPQELENPKPVHADPATPDEKNPPKPTQDSKVKKVIIIGVGATALIGGLIYFARKK